MAIDLHTLFYYFVRCSASKVNAENILCLGLSVQRATFITFDKVTGRPFHQLITWKDCRGDAIVQKFNSSLIRKGMNVGATVLHWITHSNKFKQASTFRIQNNFVINSYMQAAVGPAKRDLFSLFPPLQVTPRLSHIIENNGKLKDAMRLGRAVFGTVDTWLLHKLKNVNGFEKLEPITDITNASSTGLFDSFEGDYNAMNLKYFKIKRNILPTTVDNSYDFGYTHKSLFGAPIKIATVIADQPASLIGNGCFRNMDAKVKVLQKIALNLVSLD